MPKREKFDRASDSTKLAEMEIDAQILEKALQGKQPSAIARELSLPVSLVREQLKQWMEAYSRHLTAEAERLQIQELARLEYLYEQVLPYALARKDEQTGIVLPPDYRLLTVILRIIGEKREWAKQYHEAQREAQANQTANEVIVTTLPKGSMLLDTAVLNINEEWLRAADERIESLYEIGRDVDVEAEIASRSKKLD